MKVKLLLLIIPTLFFSACSVNKLISDANLSFANREYFVATEKYRTLNQKIKNKEQRAEVYFCLGESYRQLGEYTKASIWYKNAIKSGMKDSTLALRFADALRGAGKPKEAEQIYEAEKKKNPENRWANNGIESIHKIQNLEKAPQLYQIENLKQVNSAGNDYMVQISPENKNEIWLSSSRPGLSGKKINPATGQKYSKFFTSTFDSIKQKWTVPSNPTIEIPGNSLDEDLALTISPNQNLMVVARQSFSSEKPLRSKLFVAQQTSENHSHLAPISFTTDNSDYTDPMISDDGQTLWFSSDRTGGEGGFDIWLSKIDANGNFSEPQNAGKQINTPGNERWPFLKPNGNLYFSSDFHPGFGGFDIFRAKTVNSEQWQITQLPPPINTNRDDLAIRFFGNHERGFLSSNRAGSAKVDVYSFYLPPKLFQCFGKIQDSETDTLLLDTNIRIVGSDGSSKTIRSVNGTFQASLNSDTDYAIVVFAKGYLSAQAKLSTRGLQQAREFNLDIRPVPTNKPIRMENITYEFGKAELTESAKASLEKLVDLLKLNPEAAIEISANTDDKGEAPYNLELSEKRAASVVQYLKEKGIQEKRLQSKGYGESRPVKVTHKLARQYEFLQEGQTLDLETIEQLPQENMKEIARSLNRRTEFRVVQAGTVFHSE